MNRLGVTIHDAFGQLAAGGFQNQLRRALARPITNAHVRAALEAVAGLTTEAELFARAADVRRIEIRAFDQNVHRPVVDLGVRAAHDTGERNAFGFVSDQEHFACERALLIIERLKFFSRSRTADDDGRLAVRALGDEVIIKRVQRLTTFQHDVIGHVHHVADAAEADLFERRTQPVRAGADLHAHYDARGVAWAKLRVFEAEGDQFFNFEF